MNAIFIFLIRLAASAAITYGLFIFMTILAFIIAPTRDQISISPLAYIAPIIGLTLNAIAVAFIFYLPIGDKQKWGNGGKSRWIAILLALAILAIIFGGSVPDMFHNMQVRL